MVTLFLYYFSVQPNENITRSRDKNNLDLLIPKNMEYHPNNWGQAQESQV